MQIDNVPAGVSTLTIDGLTVRGRYRVLVRQLTDALGCTSDQLVERVIVADRITASLGCEDGPGGAPMRAGEETRLNVAIVGGTPPYRIEYQAPMHTAPTVVTAARVPYGLPLSASGVYALVNVSDAYCTAVIERPDACAVDVVARPTVNVTRGITQGERGD